MRSIDTSCEIVSQEQAHRLADLLQELAARVRESYPVYAKVNYAKMIDYPELDDPFLPGFRPAVRAHELTISLQFRS